LSQPSAQHHRPRWALQPPLRQNWLLPKRLFWQFVEKQVPLARALSSLSSSALFLLCSLSQHSDIDFIAAGLPCDLSQVTQYKSAAFRSTIHSVYWQVLVSGWLQIR
jgi:hypothetical protein